MLLFSCIITAVTGKSFTGYSYRSTGAKIPSGSFKSHVDFAPNPTIIPSQEYERPLVRKPSPNPVIVPKIIPDNQTDTNHRYEMFIKRSQEEAKLRKEEKMKQRKFNFLNLPLP